jgi:hypothetical protein
MASEHNVLDDLRGALAILRAARGMIRTQRSALIQTVAGVEVELISAKLDFAIRQIEHAFDLYARATAKPRAELVAHATLDREWRKPLLSEPRKGPAHAEK